VGVNVCARVRTCERMRSCPAHHGLHAQPLRLYFAAQLCDALNHLHRQRIPKIRNEAEHALAKWVRARAAVRGARLSSHRRMRLLMRRSRLFEQGAPTGRGDAYGGAALCPCSATQSQYARHHAPGVSGLQGTAWGQAPVGTCRAGGC